jgi:hypothetical protein
MAVLVTVMPTPRTLHHTGDATTIVTAAMIV